MITLKDQNFFFRCVFAAFFIGFVLDMTGCSSMTKQTNQDEFDHVIDQYLPENVEVKIYTSYDIQKKFGRPIDGNTWCGMKVIPGQKVKCVISTVLDAETLLHEICHVIEGNWHGDERSSDLFGCKMFNYDTLTML